MKKVLLTFSSMRLTYFEMQGAFLCSKESYIWKRQQVDIVGIQEDCILHENLMMHTYFLLYQVRVIVPTKKEAYQINDTPPCLINEMGLFINLLFTLTVLHLDIDVSLPRLTYTTSINGVNSIF